MIIWSGFGILAPIVPIIIWFVIILISQSILSADTYSSHNYLFSAFGMLLGCLALWFFGKKLNSGEGRVLLDEKSGERIVQKANHAFFFIKMEYWAIIMLVLYFVLMYVEF